MKYLIEEYWLDNYPTGKVLKDLIEENFLNQYELFEIKVELKPRNPHVISFGPSNWYIVRFRKKEEE